MGSAKFLIIEASYSQRETKGFINRISRRKLSGEVNYLRIFGHLTEIGNSSTPFRFFISVARFESSIPISCVVLAAYDWRRLSGYGLAVLSAFHQLGDFIRRFLPGLAFRVEAT